MLLKDYISKLQEFEKINPNLVILEEEYGLDEEDNNFLKVENIPLLGYWNEEENYFESWFKVSPESTYVFPKEYCNAVLVNYIKED